MRTSDDVNSAVESAVGRNTVTSSLVYSVKEEIVEDVQVERIFLSSSREGGGDTWRDIKSDIGGGGDEVRGGREEEFLKGEKTSDVLADQSVCGVFQVVTGL